MNSTSPSIDQEVDQLELNDLIIDAIRDIKGKNIIKLDLQPIDDAPVSFFIICEGDSSTQVKALADNVRRRIRDEFNVRPNHVEGMAGSKWILVDYFDTIVHIFYPETRRFYDLEDLWSDANFTEYESY